MTSCMDSLFRSASCRRISWVAWLILTVLVPAMAPPPLFSLQASLHFCIVRCQQIYYKILSSVRSPRHILCPGLCHNYSLYTDYVTFAQSDLEETKSTDTPVECGFEHILRASIKVVLRNF